VVSKIPVVAAKSLAPVAVMSLGAVPGNSPSASAELAGVPSPVVAAIRAASLNAPFQAQQAAAPGGGQASVAVVQQVRDRQTQSVLQDEIQRSKGQLQKLLSNTQGEAVSGGRQAESQRLEAEVKVLERELARLEKR
jgi:hypothetical protein